MNIDKIVKYLFMAIVVGAIVFSYKEYIKHEEHQKLIEMREDVEQGQREIDHLESLIEK